MPLISPSDPARSPLKRMDSLFEPEGYRPPSCRVTPPPGAAAGSGPAGIVQHANCLWVTPGRLPAGTRLAWDGSQGDQAIYLISGEICLAGRACGAGGAVMIDAGGTAEAEVTADAHVLHFGSDDTGPAVAGRPAAGRGARVIAIADATRSLSHGRDGTTYTLDFFGDGTAPTNTIALFTVSIDGSSFGPPHHHSEDEIISVLSGTVRSGTLTVEPGQFFAVPGDIRYSFRTEGPARFLNFRRNVSTITLKGRTDPETLAARGERHGTMAPHT